MNGFEKALEISKGGKVIAVAEMYEEDGKGNICILQDYRSPMWFDWFDGPSKERALDMLAHYVGSHFGINGDGFANMIVR